MAYDYGIFGFVVIAFQLVFTSHLVDTLNTSHLTIGSESQIYICTMKLCPHQIG